MKEYIIEVADNGMVSRVGQELIRCRDCKWIGRCDGYDLINNDNGYCFNGERKNNE